VTVTEVRADGSRWLSSTAAEEWDWLAANGKARIACLIGHPASSPKETAEFFTSAVTNLGLGDGDGIAVSLDTTDSRNPAQVSVWARMTARSLEAVLGRVPVVCTSPAFAAAGNCAGLGPYPLWIFAPDSAPGQAAVPKPWESWAVHQGAAGQCFARFTSAGRMRAALGATRAKPRQRVSPAAREFLAALNEGSPDLDARMRVLGDEIAAGLALEKDS
jgi:hypothetical protein